MILIGLGANLRAGDGSPPDITIRRAVAAVAALPGLRPVALSRLWDSAPVPASDQPRYVNAVLRLAETGWMGPEALLASLHAVEARFGRVRGARDAARTLDLDLLDFNGTVRCDVPPLLPHPRLAVRAFALKPLAEVAPGWRHPVTGEGVASLLDFLPAEDRAACCPLPPYSLNIGAQAGSADRKTPRM